MGYTEKVGTLEEGPNSFYQVFYGFALTEVTAGADRKLHTNSHLTPTAKLAFNQMSILNEKVVTQLI